MTARHAAPGGTLSRMTRDAAIRALSTDDPEAWEEALLELDGRHDRATDAAVLQFLQRLDPGEWWDHDDAAFLALAHLSAAPPDDAVAPALRWALETAGDAQAEACELLANACALQAVPAIQQRLLKGGPPERGLDVDEALGALLARLEESAAEPFLFKLLARREFSRKLAALAGLRALPRVSSLEKVRRLARAGHDSSSAVLTLLVHDDPEGLALLDALGDDDRELLLLRGRSMARLDLCEALLARLDLPSWREARAHAYGYLLARGSSKGAALAKQLTSSPEEPRWLRVQLSAQLVEFGGATRQVNRLLALLHELDEDDLPSGEPVSQQLRPLFSIVSSVLEEHPAFGDWLEGLDALAEGDSEIASAARSYRRLWEA